MRLHCLSTARTRQRTSPAAPPAAEEDVEICRPIPAGSYADAVLDGDGKATLADQSSVAIDVGSGILSA
jgi:hypothetical protein